MSRNSNVATFESPRSKILLQELRIFIAFYAFVGLAISARIALAITTESVTNLAMSIDLLLAFCFVVPLGIRYCREHRLFEGDCDRYQLCKRFVLAAGLVTVLVDLVFAQYQGREFLSIYALVVALVVAMIVDLRIFVKT